jgi:hypothetical protein
MVKSNFTDTSTVTELAQFFNRNLHRIFNLFLSNFSFLSNLAFFIESFAEFSALEHSFQLDQRSRLCRPFLCKTFGIWPRRRGSLLSLVLDRWACRWPGKCRRGWTRNTPTCARLLVFYHMPKKTRTVNDCARCQEIKWHLKTGPICPFFNGYD